MSLPNCSLCHRPFLQEEDSEALKNTLNPLIGDVFFKYTCSRCTEGVAAVERLPLSWINVIQLVLYHLHCVDNGRVGFFRWKEDICHLIEDRWDTLLPKKARTASWMNSVSSVLSANDSVFISGFEKLKQPGWWALRKIEALRPTPTSLNDSKKRKKIGTDSNELATEDDALLEVKGPADKPVNVGISSTDLRPLSFPHFPTRPSLSIDTAQTLLLTRHYADRIPNVNALLPLEREATPTTVKAAQEIKRKLVERLLRVDSKLLQEALANAPVPLPHSPDSLNIISSLGLDASFSIGNNLGSFSSSSQPIPLSSASASSSLQSTPSIISTGPTNNLLNKPESANGIGKIKPDLIRKELKKLQKPSRPPNYVRASPHENELFELCLRAIDANGALQRFKRKLLIRRAKRRAGLSIFDLDQAIYQYLKSNEPLLFPERKNKQQDQGQLLKKQNEHGLASTEDSLPSRPKTYFEVPYHRDPSLSFKTKLIGISNVLTPYPAERISPYTGLRLPAFLHKEHTTRPLKIKLFNELQTRIPVYDPEPSCDTYSPAKQVDFIFMKKEWLSQVNRLLRRFFWPGIDMIDALDYPDYGILVMYKKLLIGCAFMTPDAYITYFFIHPEWSNSGLGKILLYLIINKVAPKHLDVTLHVSATNPALILYQACGFKPEEYIVNFYDKYYKDEDSVIGQMHRFSKNAFFIRYRR